MTMFDRLPYDDSIVEKMLILALSRLPDFLSPVIYGNYETVTCRQKFPLGWAMPIINCLPEP